MNKITDDNSPKHEQISTLIANLRHELRTPINAIIGYSEMLLEDVNAEKDQELFNKLQQINDAGDEVLKIINQSLDSSREKTIKSFLEITSILDNIEVEIKPFLEIIQQNCQSFNSNNALVEFLSDIERIQTAASSLQSLVKSVLPISIAELSTPEELPELSKVIIEKSEQSDDIQQNNFAANQIAHILVVDDNENNRDLLSRQLQREGYTTTTAINGKEALQMIETGEYDLVLLDLMMPEIDGYQVLKRLKVDEKWRHIPVIMISASDELDRVVSCIEIGAEDYLPKPFNPVLLKARIGASLEKKYLRDREMDYLQQVQTYSQKLNLELEIGRKMQLNFLPAQLLQIPNWKVAAFFKPARQVAGDFYDTFEVMDNVGLVIADVCDKGVGAALFMALFRSLIRIFAEQTPMRSFDPNLSLTKAGIDAASLNTLTPTDLTHFKILEAVSLTNNYVADNHGDLGMFATLFFGILEPKTGLLTYINGGHETLFIINTQGEIKQQLNSTGPAVGMMPNSKFKIKQVYLESGDILLGYTDGVPDARAVDGDFFTKKRLLNIVQQPADSPSILVDKITKNVLDHILTADQFDDITMLSIQRCF